MFVFYLFGIISIVVDDCLDFRDELHACIAEGTAMDGHLEWGTVRVRYQEYGSCPWTFTYRVPRGDYGSGEKSEGKVEYESRSVHGRGREDGGGDEDSIPEGVLI